MDITDQEFEKRAKLQENIAHLSNKCMLELVKIITNNKGKYFLTAKGTIMFDLILQSQETIDSMIEYTNSCIKDEKSRRENIEDEYTQIRQRLEERNQIALIKRKTRTKKNDE